MAQWIKIHTIKKYYTATSNSLLALGKFSMSYYSLKQEIWRREGRIEKKEGEREDGRKAEGREGERWGGREEGRKEQHQTRGK